MGRNTIVSIIVRLKDETKKGLRGLKDAFFGLQGAIAGVVGGVITTTLFNLGTTAEETGSKFRTVFGDSADALDDVAAKWGRFAGLTKTKARDILATTGAVGQGFGMMLAQSAAFAESVARLSGDLSSFHNRDIREVNHAIVSALAGEREALKSLGIVVTENDVQQKALAMTRKRAIGEITAEEKAYATLAIVQARAGVAVGDLERTQNSLANRFRRLRADVGNLADRLAVALLPTFEQLTILVSNNLGTIEAVVNGFVKGAEWAMKFAGGIAALIAEIPVLVANLNLLGLQLADLLPWNDVSEDQYVAAFDRIREAAAKRDADLLRIGGFDPDAAASKGAFASVFGGAGDPKGLGNLAYGTGTKTAEETREQLAKRIDGLLAAAARDAASRNGDLATREIEGMFLAREREFLDGVQAWVGKVGDVDLFENLTPQAPGGGPGALGFGFLGETIDDVAVAMGALRELDDLVQGSMLTGFEALGDAITGAFAAAVTGSQSAGDAFAQAMLGALASVAKGFGDFYMAKAVASLGDFLTGNPAAAGAAVKYTAAAGLMYALSGVASGLAFGGRGGGYGGLSRNEFETKEDVLGTRESATLVVEGGFLDMTDPRQADALAKALGDLSGRRVTVVGR